MDGQNDIAAILAVLVKVALEAGDLVRAAFGQKLQPFIKADASPVTQADIAAEALIEARLSEAFPAIAIVAEEAVSAGRLPADLGRRFFLVDPIDGTREFVGGHPDFTVNIALVEAGRAVAGVIVAPAHGEIFTGSPAGAFKGKLGADGRCALLEPMQVREPARPPVILVSRSRTPTAEVEAFLRRHGTESGVPTGSSLKFCRIAEGVADLYPCLGRTKEWDTAAGQAILEAAGGAVLGLYGHPMLYAKRQAGTDDFANPDFVAMGSRV